MNRRHFLGSITAFSAGLAWTSNIVGAAEAAADRPKIRVLLITGGHDFEKEQFYKLFKDNQQITLQTAEHPKAHALFKPEAASQYDVIVQYDMWQKITDEAKTDFVNLLKQGKGLVALHHCLGGYQDWPEYAKIIGGKYNLNKTVVNGVEKPASTYKHGVKFKVNVSQTRHPIIRGLTDFEILDETYGGFDVSPDVTPLLTTEEPTSGKTVCWAHQYEKSRVTYIALGHDHFAYENPSFIQLISQAIRWASGRGRRQQQ